MYRVSKNLSNELKAIKSKSQKIDFAIQYISKLVDKKNIKVLQDGEVNELMCVIDSSMQLASKKQKEECSVILDALVVEEAKRIDRALNQSFLGKLKKKILKFIRNLN